MSTDGLILAYDLGTGGNKASLYDSSGACLAEVGQVKQHQHLTTPCR